jgi:hypothetical protein
MEFEYDSNPFGGGNVNVFRSASPQPRLQEGNGSLFGDKGSQTNAKPEAIAGVKR